MNEARWIEKGEPYFFGKRWRLAAMRDGFGRVALLEVCTDSYVMAVKWEATPWHRDVVVAQGRVPIETLTSDAIEAAICVAKDESMKAGAIWMDKVKLFYQEKKVGAK